MTIDFHPVSDMFPLMTGDEYRALVADIAENGQREPIWLHPDGRIIDGRNRYQAMIDLGTRAGVPVIAVRYTEDFSSWKAMPLNRMARQYLPVYGQEMSEREWVTFLYNLRGYPPPDSLFEGDGIAI